MSPRFLPYGASALLVELADLDEVLALYERLRADPPAGVTELVPAARTVLIGFDPVRTSAAPLSAIAGKWLSGEGSEPAEPRNSGTGGGVEVVEVPVRYDGPDLAEVARLTGLDEGEVVTRHLAGTYRSAFCGFAPGFAYLAGLDPSVVVSRRDEPRTRVPAGSVGLAAEFTAVYPRQSPGGWQLIGRTDFEVWDVDRDPPAVLAPGTVVRFVDAGT